MRLRKMTKG
jgi:hypothetical protein